MDDDASVLNVAARILETYGFQVETAPDGTVLVETTAPVTNLILERSAVARARQDYPGYLAVRADLYSRAWGEVSRP